VLSNETMGLFALSVVWLNTLLIAASAWQVAAAQGRLLSDLRAAKRRGELVRGRVLRGNGQGGSIAERRVQQIGRAMTTRGADRILFTDRQSETVIAGGEVEIDGARVSVGAGEGEVWTIDERGRRDPSAFDAAWSRAATNKGVESDVVIPVAGEVWLRGRRDGDRLEADLVATRCPITLVSRTRWAQIAFALGAVAVVSAITAVCLVPPVFGTVSTVGGALMVAFFIGIQPLGVMVRDATRPPPERPVGGVWERPAALDTSRRPVF
jgi:hypothetical protein